MSNLWDHNDTHFHSMVIIGCFQENVTINLVQLLDNKTTVSMASSWRERAHLRFGVPPDENGTMVSKIKRKDRAV